MTDTAAKSAPAKHKFWLVKLTHPNHHDRIVFRSISEQRAKVWLEQRYPRGSEAYLESPEGKTFHYEAERTGDLGMHADTWAEFNLEAWVPPDQQPPPGDTEWADKEG